MNSPAHPKQPDTVLEFIKLLGGSKKVADALGCTQSGVCNWQRLHRIAMPWKDDMQKLADEAGVILLDKWFIDPNKKLRRAKAGARG